MAGIRYEMPTILAATIPPMTTMTEKIRRTPWESSQDTRGLTAYANIAPITNSNNTLSMRWIKYKPRITAMNTITDLYRLEGVSCSFASALELYKRFFGHYMTVRYDRVC